MLEYLPKMCTADEVFKTMDPRRDTGGVGQMFSWSIFAFLLNLTSTLYSYFSNPISICSAYVLVYCVFGYYIYNFESHIQMLNKDDVAHCNPRVRYGKGRYKYTTSRPSRKGDRKGSPKDPPKRKKYTRRQRFFGGWRSEYKWKPLLDCDYSNYFDLNCNQYSHYLDAVMDKIEAFEGGKGGPTQVSYCFNGLIDDVFVPVGVYVNNNGMAIVFDTGCSVAVTPYLEDFIGPSQR